MVSERTPRNLSPIKCPACVGPLEYLEVRLVGEFRCPTCDKLLCVSFNYFRLIFFESIALSGLLSYWVGLRWFWFYVATMTLWLPISIPLGILMKRLAPPTIRIYEPKEFSLNPFNRLRR